MAKIVFKELTSNQNVLFPVSLSEKIASNHPVRVVNSVVDALDISSLLRAYKGGGTSSYHPRMMLKVLFYAYLNNIYSCRKIEKALQENIHFMWLSGNSTPDFRTINDFRGKRLKEVSIRQTTGIKLLYTTIATVTMNLIVSAAIVLLNPYVTVYISYKIPPFALSVHIPDVSTSIYVEVDSKVLLGLPFCDKAFVR